MSGVTITEGLRDDQVEAALRIFYEAFSVKLRGFRDADEFVGLFRRAVLGDLCIVATGDDGRLLGVLTLKWRGREFLQLRLGLLFRRFAPWRAVCLLARLLLLHTGEKGAALVVDMAAVAPASRGLGVGTLLLEAAEAKGREYGAPRMALFVLGDNDGAIRLYERQGYVRTKQEHGSLVRLAVGSESVWRMEKPLP